MRTGHTDQDQGSKSQPPPHPPSIRRPALLGEDHAPAAALRLRVMASWAASTTAAARNRANPAMAATRHTRETPRAATGAWAGCEAGGLGAGVPTPGTMS